MRAVWQGYISLGRLGIPIKLYGATQSVRPQFVQLHDKDGSPVERETFCRAEGRQIEPSEIVRAVEIEPGRYIALTDEELSRVASGPLKTLAVQQFCDPTDIASVYYDKPFYVVPSRGGERAYALLREVLVRIRKLAIVKFLIYGKERIAALCTHGDMLIVQQLRYAAEIVPRSTIKTPPLPKPAPEEIEVLSSVVERFSGPFYIDDYHDEHAEHIVQLIERKAKGLPSPKKERMASYATPEESIMEALEATLQTKARPQIG